MSIIYQEAEQSFILHSKSSSYILRITKNKYLEHVYYGPKIEQPNVNIQKEFFRIFVPIQMMLISWIQDQEYPAYGNTDLHLSHQTS